MWEITVWFLEVAVLLFLARVFEGIAERIGQPKVFAWVIVGLLVPLANYKLSWVTESLGILGIISYLFYVGLEGSLKGFMRGLKEAGIIALGGVIASLGLGLIIMLLMGFTFKESFSVGVALSATSVSITVKTLEELDKMHRREAQAILGAAVVDDVLGLALLSTLLGISAGSLSEVTVTVIEVVTLAFAFWFGIAFTFQKMADPLYRFFSRLSEEEPILTLTFIILLVLAFIADELRLSSILLAYAFGLGLSSHKYIARRIERLMNPFITLFTPLFFIAAGSMFSIKELQSVNLADSLTVMLVVIAMGMLSKVIGCYLPAKVLGFSHKDSLIIGFGMIPRGEVMMTVVVAARAAGMLSLPVYIALILLLPITSLSTPPVLSKLYGRG
jgi:Kef-type K+ transport system membrane component KefB